MGFSQWTRPIKQPFAAAERRLTGEAPVADCGVALSLLNRNVNPITSHCSPVTAPTPKVCTIGLWTLHEYAVCTSTNMVAAQLPAWSAVRADTQTKGRGRFERNWVSDAGGLWLSAVVPIRQKSAAWHFLPVAIGFAVCQALGSLGVKNLRLRWPNDVLVGRLKLAGLLLDQFSPNLVVAGIGINVRNQAQNLDASLVGQITRLSDLITHAPGLMELTLHVLESVHGVCTQLQAYGPKYFLPQVNSLWQAPRLVKLDLDGRQVQGEFVGVDTTGRLELRDANRSAQFFEPQDVRCLREIF